MMENIFQNRLGDIYEYSPLKYINGNGVISSEGQTRNVNWELCLDICGESHLQISYSGIQFSKGSFFLRGETEDKCWEIESQNVYILSREYNSEGSKNIFYCKTREINITKKQCTSEITKAEVFITNFDFTGLEWSENKDSSVLNKFSVALPKMGIQFILNEHHKSINELLRRNRITKAILSKMIVNLNDKMNTDELNNEVTKITLFLSSLTLNSNYEQLINYYHKEELVAFKIIDTVKMDFRRGSLIDNLRIFGGIKNAFIQSYQQFKLLNEPLKLSSFIDRVVDMQQQNYLDNKLVILIIAYESLLTNYLIYKGSTESEIEEMNIQQKLGRLNRELRFIPSELMGENLREARNPLFHTGTIPLLNINELSDIYSKYNDLLMRIFLRIISYDGEYISRINDKSTSV